ncbi:hypothetical protein ACH4SP_04050 [Streptomyces sp. NPDC021093]|uniref:bestrophin-like domain n=1 Tax=Streptomyces sp. NPDC021093 TaxID=3365112 RepID=UPI00378DACCA
MPLLGILLLSLASLLATGLVFGITRIVPLAKRKPHNDVLGFVYAEIGVIYAVVLALVVVGVWDTRSQAHANTYTETNALLQIAWYGRSLPAPEQATLEGLTEKYTVTVVEVEWPLLSEQRASPEAWALFTALRDFINTRQPRTGADEVRYGTALEAVAQLGDARRERVNEAATAGVPALLWVALLIGAAVTVGFVYLFGISSLRIHSGVVFCLSLTVGVMLLIVYEFNLPFSGALKVDPTAFQLALERIRAVA